MVPIIEMTRPLIGTIDSVFPRPLIPLIFDRKILAPFLTVKFGISIYPLPLHLVVHPLFNDILQASSRFVRTPGIEFL